MASGLDLTAIMEALAGQVRANISRDVNVSAFPLSARDWPLIEVWPDTGDTVSYYSTFGATGAADVVLLLRLYMPAPNAETGWRIVSDLLSQGTGHGSSIVDAVMVDRTLGGVVADCVVLRARWTPLPQLEGDAVAELPVEIITMKQGAQV